MRSSTWSRNSSKDSRTVDTEEDEAHREEIMAVEEEIEEDVVVEVEGGVVEEGGAHDTWIDDNGSQWEELNLGR
jgi:hypothetical protein